MSDNASKIIELLASMARVLEQVQNSSHKRPEPFGGLYPLEVNDIFREIGQKKQRIEEPEAEGDAEGEAEEEKKEEEEDMAPWEARFAARRALTPEEIEKLKYDVAVEIDRRNLELSTYTKTKRNDSINMGVREKWPSLGNVQLNPTLRSKIKPAQTEFVLNLAAFALLDLELLASFTSTLGRIGIVRVAAQKHAEELTARSPLSSGIDDGEQGYATMVADIVSGILFIKQNKKNPPIV